MVPLSDQSAKMSQKKSSPDLKTILLAVEKSGPKAVTSLCLLSGVSEADFKAVLHEHSGHQLATAQRQDVEKRLQQALGLQNPTREHQSPGRIARDQWPETPLKSLQILRGVQHIERPVEEIPAQPNWPMTLALILYLAISLTYALGLYGQL